MFHNVSDEDVDAPLSCKCRIGEFKKILNDYKNKGFVFVDIDKAINYLKEEKKQKFVVITFDDIPENVYTNAYPILQNKNIPFTIFVCVDFIDKVGFVKKDQLLELSSSPLCTVGAHSMTHVNFSKIEDCKWEIINSKNLLEQIIGKEIKYFAYPYGSKGAVPSDACIIAKEAGFCLAFSAVNAPLSYNSYIDNRWFLPRVVARRGEVVTFHKQSLFRTAIRKVLGLEI